MAHKSGDSALAPSTSASSTLEKSENVDTHPHNPQTMEDANKTIAESSGDKTSSDTSSSGFVFIMTVAALAMSMFLVIILIHWSLSKNCKTNTSALNRFHST